MNLINNEEIMQIDSIYSANVFNQEKSDNAGIIKEYYQLLCVHSGEVALTAGAMAYNCNSEAAVLLPAGVISNIRKQNSESACSIISFSIKGDKPKFNGIKAAQLPDFESRAMQEIKSLISNSKSEIIKNSSKLAALTQLLVAYLINAEDLNVEGLESFDMLQFRNAVDILESKIETNISVAKLAEIMDISVSTVKRLFLRYAGMGVHEYLTLLKINRAKEYLRQGITIARTAELTGFSNQNYFSTAFKRITEKSPKEYAKENSQKDAPRERKPRKKRKSDMPSYLL